MTEPRPSPRWQQGPQKPASGPRPAKADGSGHGGQGQPRLANFKWALIEGELRDRPEVSNRTIAKELGVHHTTVSTAPDKLVEVGEISRHEERKGRDGVVQPASTSKKPKPISSTTPGISATTRKATGPLRT